YGAALEPQPVAEAVRLLGLAAAVDRAPGGRDLLEVERGDIGGDGQVEEDPLTLPVLGEIDDAGIDAVSIGADDHRLAGELHLARAQRMQPADRLDDLAASRADEPRDTDYLTSPQRERDIAEAAGVGEALYHEHVFLDTHRRVQLGRV